MKQLKIINAILTLFLLLGLFSCKNNARKDEVQKIVTEWIGKEILFPEDAQCCVLGKDTTENLCAGLLQREYKVLLYVDSTGCSGCRLKLSHWRQLIEESDSLYQEKVGFLFFFQPKSKKDMLSLFKSYNFYHPAFIDIHNKIDHLNHFPQTPEYQCFLLDKNNHVLSIGNPVSNFKVWKLYKKQILGDTVTQQEKPTSIEADKTSYDFGDIRTGESNTVDFQLKNTGNEALLIHQVTTSCGCTAADWDKQPIAPGKTAKIKVKIKPEEQGYFNKTVDVYCNIKESPVKLTVSGTANQ
jgi:hypothetical protein